MYKKLNQKQILTQQQTTTTELQTPDRHIHPECGGV